MLTIRFDCDDGQIDALGALVAPQRRRRGSPVRSLSRAIAPRRPFTQRKARIARTSGHPRTALSCWRRRRRGVGVACAGSSDGQCRGARDHYCEAFIAWNTAAQRLRLCRKVGEGIPAAQQEPQGWLRTVVDERLRPSPSAEPCANTEGYIPARTTTAPSCSSKSVCRGGSLVGFLSTLGGGYKLAYAHGKARSPCSRDAPLSGTMTMNHIDQRSPQHSQRRTGRYSRSVRRLALRLIEARFHFRPRRTISFRTVSGSSIHTHPCAGTRRPRPLASVRAKSSHGPNTSRTPIHHLFMPRRIALA